MIDLHCHILPGVDDGAPDEATALQMAHCLVDVGFAKVAASPHFGESSAGDVAIADATRVRHALNARLRAAHLPLEIVPNAEHHVSPLLFERIVAGDVMPIGGAGHWLLVELPWHEVPNVETVLFHLQTKGYRLLLAHPERYSYLGLDVIERLVARDIKLQLELGSFVDVYGRRARKHAVALADGGHAHVLATDLHRPEQARKWLQHALDEVRQRYGDAAVQAALSTNPQALFDDALPHQVAAFTP